MSRVVINSKGEVIQLNDDNMMRLISPEVKFAELREEASKLIGLLNEQEIDTQGKKFFYMVQPLFYKERIYFFTKIKIPSSSESVKMADIVKKNPEEVLKNPELKDNLSKISFYKSIIPYEDKDSVSWYYISLCYIEFERNFYDCKKINIESNYFKPLYLFNKELEDILIKENNRDKVSNKFVLDKNDIDFTDNQTITSIAFEIESNYIDSDFVNKIENVKENYTKKYFNNVYFNSNIANKYLIILNQKKNVYKAYEKIKNTLRKEYQLNDVNINYNKKSNQIVVGNDETNVIKIYVKNPNDENLQFVIGGKDISIEEIVEIIRGNKKIESEEWFTNKVEPYL